MQTQAHRIDVLTYHSISDGHGPTCIPAATLRGHLEFIDACGYTIVSVDDFVSWQQGQKVLPQKSIVITFDDGFADFAEQAFPILRQHRATATVFLPTGKVGGVADWDGDQSSPNARLMSWQTVKDLANEGIGFGSHSVTHADLTKLSPQQLVNELVVSKQQVVDRIGKVPTSFAPPYGVSNDTVRRAIGDHYDAAFGTRLQYVDRTSNRYDIPRIEMHYFRDMKRWRAHLAGRGHVYFMARRTLRGVRQKISQFGGNR